MSTRSGGRFSSGRTLLLAFSGVAVAFVLSTAVAEYSDLEIQRAATQIMGSAAPGIANVAALRSEIRRFVLLADDAVDRGVDGLYQAPEPDLWRARDGIDRTWAEYRRLPVTDPDAAVADETRKIKEALDASILRLDRQMARNAWSEARDTLAMTIRPITERLDETLLRLVERNAARGAALASHIEILGRRSIGLAFGLDAISVLLALFTASVMIRVVRRYTRLVELRADELELFAGRVAHDVLGPLGAASLALDVAAADALAGSRAQRVIASGQAGLHRAQSIADALLDFARAGAQPTPGMRADVAEVVRAVLDEIAPEAQARQVTVQVEMAQPGAVACAPGILTSIVSNLLRNAIKYVGDAPRRRVTVRALPVGRVVRLEVEDNGPGLPEALGQQIFQPYVRGAGSREPGIGLGLATVKKITEAHGGRIDVRSVPGLGCRFGVELPCVPEAPGRTRSRPGRRENESVDRQAQAP
jgi:signal transduction histidine kinase